MLIEVTQEGNLPGARFCHFAAGRPLPILLLARFYPIKFGCHALTSNSGQSGRGDARSVSSYHTAAVVQAVVVKECRVCPFIEIAY